MIKLVSANKQYEVDASKSDNASLLINGASEKWDIISIGEGTYHILYKNHSYTIDVIEYDSKNKQFKVAVNGKTYEFDGKDANDLLLEKLGMENLAVAKAENIKAPMPGLVLSIEVSAGDAIKKGDTVLVLEAMKMENNLKASEDGVVKHIEVKEKDAVERNQILISLE